MQQIIWADVYSGLSKLNDNSVDVAITSPPYWGQRDYGFKGQIGNELTYNEYMGKLVAIYNLLRQKLKKNGIFFLNIGDKYLSKYGKSSLGMIPYKLAYFMTLEGWILNDIIIWYKPNHMPSSIKNRFTNSYEPVFVFSKAKDNIFTERRKNYSDYSNILKINLQPNLYRHVAVYPENLVLNLLNMVNLPQDGLVLDPFAGSGTTLKVVQNMNCSFESKNLSAIMIEHSREYVEIMKKRCSLSDKDVITGKFIPYSHRIVRDGVLCFDNKEELSSSEKTKKNGLLNICSSEEEYYARLSSLLNGKTREGFSKDAILFIGSKEFDIELIYNTSLLSGYGWIIRNMIAVEYGRRWFPLFMIVDDNKMVKYKFDYKKLNLKHKHKDETKWNQIDFVGYKVVDNLKKEKREGLVIKVLERNATGFPKYVIVEWEDGTSSREFVIYSEEEVRGNLEFISGSKGNEYKDSFFIKEKKKIIDLCTSIKYDGKRCAFNSKRIDKKYNGKFKDEARKNWGASPGARASVEESYFSKRRLYEVNQPLVADYLNYKRIKKGLSKNDLINLFSLEYKHTVGHWLRKDFGGSIPLPEDWEFLSRILDIDSCFTNYVCKAAMKLQTVRNGEYKLPDDFISIDFLDKLKMLAE